MTGVQTCALPIFGHEYNQSWHNDGSTTITDGQEFYSKTIQPVAVPSGPRTRLLVEQERSDLRHINGEMSYAKETRPDAMGRIAYSQQNVDKDACVEHLIEANKALEVLHDPKIVKVLTYAPLDGRYLKLVGVADGALRKKSEKYSQGCFYILIQEVLEGDIGGRCWIVEFRTKRATRVSNSSMSAEVLILVRCSEAKIGRAHV